MKTNPTKPMNKPNSREDDRQLMNRIAAGDDKAFEELCERYTPLVYSTAMKVLNHVDDARDVTHDVLLSIWQKADKYHSDKGSLVTWICTTTRNRSIDRVRSFQRRAALYDRYETSLKREKPRESRCGREEVYRSNARDILESVVVELTPEQREVIELAYFDGLTQRQIADRIQSPLGTVKARIRRGVEKMRTMMNDRFSGEGEFLMNGLTN